jgi:lysophospholipid acyltransferase (LPLAT)-like uncharacterized protein
MHGYQMDLTRGDQLFAFLHGDMLIPAYLFRRVPAAIMISQHGDGELIAQVEQRLGRHVPVRGSTTRGGARAFLEIVQQQGDIAWAITPDGPRGPRGRVHDGVVLLASESGRAIQPAGFAASRAWRTRSWDRFVIPRPFARIAGYIAEPLAVPAGLPREERRKYAHELEQRLRRAGETAQEALLAW